LISDVRFVDKITLGQSDLEHGHDSAEFKVIKTFNKWLKLINNCDVADFVDLVETFDSMLD